MTAPVVDLEPIDIDGDESAAVSRSSRDVVRLSLFAYCWMRVLLVVAVGPFETPDTESYRSWQWTRPPVSAALLAWLPDLAYVLLSAIVSTAGFVALMWAVWDEQHRRRSITIAVLIGAVSMLPSIFVYEHWLVPDSLLIGLALLLVAISWRRPPLPWFPAWWAGLAVVVTLTKEVGFFVVLLAGLVLVVRGAWRVAVPAALACAVLFATVILPASDREGIVLWHQPRDTEITMERFRVVVSGLFWGELSPELAEVERLSAQCGMTLGQLIGETFQLNDQVVAFRDCDALWAKVDSMSQLDVLLVHVRDPRYIPASIERGFYADTRPLSMWSDSPLQQRWIVAGDRWPTAAVSALPLVALVVTLLRRRGRLLALVAVTATAGALAAALVDPTGQDRHTIVFRVVAAAIAVFALLEAAERTTAPEPAVSEPVPS